VNMSRRGYFDKSRLLSQPRVNPLVCCRQAGRTDERFLHFQVRQDIERRLKAGRTEPARFEPTSQELSSEMFFPVDHLGATALSGVSDFSEDFLFFAFLDFSAVAFELFFTHLIGL